MDTVKIIGNIISLIGACIMVAIGFIKKKDKVLLAQCAQFAIMGLGNFVLSAFGAVISNAVSIVRNLVCIKYKFTLPLKIFFIGLLIAVSVVTALFTKAEMDTLISWFPIISAVVFTVFMDTKNAVTLKIVIIATELLWVIYDFIYYNYTSMTFDILTLISNFIGIITILNKKKISS